MLQLMIKDIVVQKKTILLGFLYILVMALAFSATSGAGPLVASTVALVYLLIQTPCAHDDKSRADYLLNSLPVSRDAIVVAKYLSVVLYVAIAAAEYMIIWLLVKLLSLPFNLAALDLENFVGMVVVAGVFAAVYYPIFFKFGYMKTRYVNIVLFCGFFAAGSILLMQVKDNALLQSLAVELNNQPDWLVGMGILGVMLGLALVSCLLSFRFYRRREF